MRLIECNVENTIKITTGVDLSQIMANTTLPLDEVEALINLYMETVGDEWFYYSGGVIIHFLLTLYSHYYCFFSV